MKFGKFDLDELLALMDRHHVSELSLRRHGQAIEIKKSASAAQHSAAPQPRPAAGEKSVAEPDDPETQPTLLSPEPLEIIGEKFYQVQAPLVGTFYRAPAPDASPFIEVGDQVKVGDTLCIIEAMKNMNEIQIDVNGIIREICVKNGSLVEFGQVLFKIEETSPDS